MGRPRASSQIFWRWLPTRHSRLSIWFAGRRGAGIRIPRAAWTGPLPTWARSAGWAVVAPVTDLEFQRPNTMPRTLPGYPGRNLFESDVLGFTPVNSLAQLIAGTVIRR